MNTQLIDLYKQESQLIFNSINNEDIICLFNLIWSHYQSQNNIFLCGNGGTVGCISNIISDWNIHSFSSENKSAMSNITKRIKVIDLTSNISVITAIANDMGFNFVFSEQLKYLAQHHDLLIALSGSGNSSNIINACTESKKKLMTSIIITRNESAKAIALCDFKMVIKGTSIFPGQMGSNNINFHYEDCLLKISHIITGLLKHYVS